MKEIPRSGQRLSLDPSSKCLIRSGPGMVNPLDLHAVEAALRLRDAADSGEVVIVSMAPAHALDSLRHALAMGADRALLVTDEMLAGSDLLATSRVLARVLERERPEIALFGAEARDSNGALLWAAVAERLQLPVLSRVVELQLCGGRVFARRELEGRYDVADAPLPCLVALAGEVNLPRHPSLKQMISAKRASIAVLAGDDLGLDAADVGERGSGTWVIRIEAPPTREPALLIEGGLEAAPLVLGELRGRGLV